jgi:hypothetical protein
LLSAARAREERHEWLGTAVDGGNLDAVDLDAEVVDAEPGRRGHEVLDRLHPRPVLSHGRRIVRIDDALRRCGNRVAVAGHVEHDAGIRGSGTEGDPARLAGMKPHTVQTDLLPGRPLVHGRVDCQQRECHNAGDRHTPATNTTYN